MIPERMDIQSLSVAYAQGLKPSMLVQHQLDRMEQEDCHGVWISRFSPEQLMAMATRLDGRSPEDLPLYGIPFAIKDNIDVQGLMTTAACPAFAYEPEVHATVVEQLIAQGALPVGKTNLDQFATGLNGTRSPYGICRNAYDPDYIAGGSSSGSAVAVAKGWVSFSLGTDTAGSGRIPAAFNNLVGLKPSRGLVSSRGVVPACRTLDCVSIFAQNIRDVRLVFDAVRHFDPLDPFARPCSERLPPFQTPLRVGVPQPDQLRFFGDMGYARLYEDVCVRLGDAGVKIQEIDCRCLFEAASLLYQGPWVAERYLTMQGLLHKNPEAIFPVIREIVATAERQSAADVFRFIYRLQELKRQAEQLWDAVDVMMMPTAGRIFRVDEVLAEPVLRNTDLGYYTNFMNLLDFSAIALPAGFRPDGLPFGITFFAPAFKDADLLDWASLWERINLGDVS